MAHTGVEWIIDGHEGVLLTVPSDNIKTFVANWAVEPPTRPEDELPPLELLWENAEKALYKMKPGEPTMPFAVNGHDGIMVPVGHGVDLTVWLPLWVMDKNCPYRRKYRPARRSSPGYEGYYVPEGQQFDPSQSVPKSSGTETYHDDAHARSHSSHRTRASDDKSRRRSERRDREEQRQRENRRHHADDDQGRRRSERYHREEERHREDRRQRPREHTREHTRERSHPENRRRDKSRYRDDTHYYTDVHQREPHTRHESVHHHGQHPFYYSYDSGFLDPVEDGFVNHPFFTEQYFTPSHSHHRYSEPHYEDDFFSEPFSDDSFNHSFDAGFDDWPHRSPNGEFDHHSGGLRDAYKRSRSDRRNHHRSHRY